MTVWTHPEWLGAVGAAIAAIGLALAWARSRARQRSRALLGPRAGGPDPGDWLLFAALLLLGLALLGPRIGERRVAVPAAGIDVVFLVDVSRSMDARDVPPSRLARARRAVSALLERLEPQDRAGLAAFGERGVLLAPLTPDREALGDLLEVLDTDWVHPAGSNLGAGIRAALEAFAAAGERPRLILALSDGEDPRARRDLGAAEARRAGVRVLAAALGTEAGGVVPARGAALRDAAGREVVSRRRLQRLTRLAEATGGRVFPGDAWGELDLEQLLAALRRDAGAAGDKRVWQTLPDVPVLPLAAAGFVLLLAEAWPRPPRRTAGPLAALGVAALLGLGSAAAVSGNGEDASGIRALEARLRARPGDPRLLLHLGLARLEAGRADAAARAFAAAAVAARDPELAALAYHDLGVAQLEIGELGAARDAFLDAVALAPDDSQARFNLEWTLRALAAAPHGGARPPEPPQPEARPPGAPEAPERGAEPQRAGRDPEPGPDLPPKPGAEQRRRLLEQVGDDPARALRSAAVPERLGRPAGPAW